MSHELSIYNLIPVEKQGLITSETYIGIDFGTSTTVASICSINQQGQITTRAIPFKQPLVDGRFQVHHLLPSVLAWVNNQLLIGQGAYELKYKLMEGVNLWHSFKMELGIDLGPKYFNSQLSAGHPLATIESPCDAAGVFFNFLKQSIEAFLEKEGLNKDIRYAISIPAAFEANQRRELLSVLDAVGLSDQKQVLIDEPNAAFINYLVEYNQNSFKHYQVPDDVPLYILVFDFGAGTCDISILALENSDSGFKTKNVAISSFLPLGGNDIDKAIARHILLPQFLAQNDLNEDSLRVAEINKRVLPRLLGIAERLKVKMCKNISPHMINQSLPDLAYSDKTLKITENSMLKLARNTFQLGEFSLSYKAFSQLMEPFLDPFSEQDFCSEEGNVVSIFSPIHSALNKAELSIEDIDLQLMIGGSAQNPYVIDALKRQFPDLEIEVPQDLQAHVSAGTAVYSQLIHGLKCDLIKPITSEPLLYMTKQGIKVLVPANTPIPSQSVSFGPLKVSRDQQQTIEIPIFISSNDKLLHVIQIKSKQEQGFSLETVVQLNAQVTENKLVSIQVTINGEVMTEEYLNPFANHKLSPKEREVLKQFKKANVSALNNQGRPSVKVLNNLFEAYADAGQHIKAAELLENIQQLQPNKHNLTLLCYHYSFAGKQKQALHWSERAYKQDKNAMTAYNLALEYQDSDKDKFCQLMVEGLSINKNSICILQVYGRYLMQKDDPQGRIMLKKALDILVINLKTNNLSNDHLNRLITCASLLDELALLSEAKAEKDKRQKTDKGYNDDNLLQTSPVLLEQSSKGIR